MALDHDRVAQLFEKLDRQLGKLSSKPQPKNIHQFRTSARRVETVLSEIVTAPDRKQRKLLKLLTKLRRRAGKVRDLDVQIDALRSLKLSEQPGVKTQLLQSMSQKRTKREERFLGMLDKETVRELRRRLSRTEEDFPANGPDPLVLARTRLTRFASFSAPMNEKLLHRCRIEGKKIRYIAELAADSPEVQGIIDELKRMQDSLGEWHDWLTLNATVTKLLPDKVNSPVQAAIRNIARAKFRDAVQAVSAAKAKLVRKPVVEVQGTPAERPMAAVAARAVA